MTIDGTRCGEGCLVGISDSGAEIELTGHVAEMGRIFSAADWVRQPGVPALPQNVGAGL
jgi:hypothetical protein